MNAALYTGYLIWLLAGLADFICHRRTDLPRTSGLRESSLHLLQLGLMGVGISLAMALVLTRSVLVVLTMLVLAHAVVGYLDTRSAYGRRDLRPIEQHVHSVLDMAPIAGLAIAVFVYADTSLSGWHRRAPALGPAAWIAAIAPALVLCVAPALLEFRAAWALRCVRRPDEVRDA
ncbi:hypothetical protein [Lysobacter silvisoli]|uniref:Diguanylate cyclase n=1 Tax=Lysobacter silvisoli TaxID=2293254 RepID=A0A371JWZ5_9GAMM|nr:hypothetical protein [Lysobacter silvisoli]RDZ26165.1 hypothetical protein DX914_17995 [Lysobacter silvisoli]